MVIVVILDPQSLEIFERIYLLTCLLTKISFILKGHCITRNSVLYSTFSQDLFKVHLWQNGMCNPTTIDPLHDNEKNFSY